MHHQVGTVLEGPGQHRSGHSVVHRHPHPGRMRELAYRRQVGDLPHRIGGCLHPHQTRAARADRRRHRVKVAGIGELDVQAPGERELGQPLAHPPVQHPGNQHMITGQQRLEHRRHRGHPRAEQRARTAAALQRGQQPLGMLAGRVVSPGIDPALRVGAIRLLLVVRGQVDHRSQGTRYRIGLTQPLGSQRFSRRGPLVHQPSPPASHATVAASIQPTAPPDDPPPGEHPPPATARRSAQPPGCHRVPDRGRICDHDAGELRARRITVVRWSSLGLKGTPPPVIVLAATRRMHGSVSADPAGSGCRWAASRHALLAPLQEGSIRSPLFGQRPGR